MKPPVRFLRHDGICRPMIVLLNHLGRSTAPRPGSTQASYKDAPEVLRPTHRRDEYRPAIPQRVARQHCPPPLHRHAHPKTVPGSGTMNFQRTVNSVLTVCLSPGDNPIKERTIGVDLFRKPADWDTKSDSTVRTYAARLRSTLREYYESEGFQDRIRIEIPVGSYIPVFHIQEPEVSAPAASDQVAMTSQPVRLAFRWPLRSHFFWLCLAIIAVLAVWLFRPTIPDLSRDHRSGADTRRGK